jgi:hypothetical protein
MCTFLGCSKPAIYGVERAYMSSMVHCLEHMEEIAPGRTAPFLIDRSPRQAKPESTDPG